MSSVCSVRNSLHVGIIGAGECGPELAGIAEEVGRRLAESGAVLVCGGKGGVMEAACRGAKSVGGLTVGIIPGSDRAEANPHVDVAIATGLGEVRNLAVVRTADVLIAIGGSYGTLSEIGFALKAGKKVVGLKTWEVTGTIRAETPEQALALVNVTCRN
uniref:TIGR00725 family protein n=1 Tax=candidate division WOR-3 bacterium TaxID=2052148 RepID=A0A7C4CEK1_UNCW3